MDFTVKIYRQLLDQLIACGYDFQPLRDYLTNPSAKVIILRHDVEARYENALTLARIQHEQGINGTYFFRILPDHFDAEIIRQIAAMNHEIGYHYDDLSHCKGDYEKAIRRFEKNLQMLREIAEVKTICMEGAPLSKYDNRDLWEKLQIPNSKFQTNSKFQISKAQIQGSGIHYRDYGIIGEPYFDIDFTKVFYLTDTGRRWDGSGVSVRDKVSSQQSAVSDENSKFQIPNSKFQIPNKLKIQNSKLKI